MSFHEVRLPDDIERGALGGPRFSTRILTLASGYEQRNIEWQQTRGQWDIGYGVMNMDNPDDQVTCINMIRDFFYARRGRAYGFRFRDWSDYEIGNPNDAVNDHQTVGLGDGVTTQFQIFKRYESGGESFDRTIKKIVSDTAVVLLDGVVVTVGASVNVNTGLITFVTPPLATGGTAPGGEQAIGIACEFDVPVRFDIDELRINTLLVDVGSVPSIPLVELRV